ncbi:MAG TPA: RNA 2',3'-cyclic phosphodiesterase [Sphaerochaeta sp.]|nr:RNA 2',3'-cyclic phosphodiesterase [Sphaerochaeta sp.]
MRLFYALEFDTATRDTITILQQDLTPYCPKCLFTPYMNLHLTLCFLGEVEGHYLTLLKETLFSLEAKPFSLNFNQLGQFRKRQGDILWLGMEENRELEALQKELAYKLQSKGLILEDQAFHPHVTLARSARTRKLPAIEAFEVTSNKITLMHSHQKQDILTYTPLFTRHLDQTAII